MQEIGQLARALPIRAVAIACRGDQIAVSAMSNNFLLDILHCVYTSGKHVNLYDYLSKNWQSSTLW